MPDQANHLRQLARRCASPEVAPATGRRPFVLLVAGGKGGVGTTTVAVHLATALATGGQRAVLIDADAHGGDTAVLCGVEPRFTLADLLDGRRTVHDVLQCGPGGVRLLPGHWNPRAGSGDEALHDKRLRAAFDDLAQDTDVVVCDVGRGTSRVARAARAMADRLLAVTTPEPASILSVYALLRMLGEANDGPSVRVLVNRARDAGEADDVHRRLARTSRRFHGVPLTFGGYLPADPQVARVFASPQGELARCLARLAAESIAGPIADARIPENPLSLNVGCVLARTITRKCRDWCVQARSLRTNYSS